MEMWETIATERRRLADELEQLTPEQWNAPSQCEAWDVRHAAAHVVMPFELSTGQFLAGMVKNGFNLDKMAVNETEKIASRMSNEEIIQAIRDNAENKWTPAVPGFGAEIPLSEVVVHGQDIRNALGMECTVPQETIDLTLEGIKKDKIREDYRRRIGA